MPAGLARAKRCALLANDHITTWMRTHLDEREAHRSIHTTVGLIDICQGHHTSALVLQALLDNLADARAGRRPWSLHDERVFVEATYREWFARYRLRRKPTARAFTRLGKLGLVSRRTMKGSTSDRFGATALYVSVVEHRLASAWNELMTKGAFDVEPDDEP